ncbi:MAG: pitrilysin family protein [Armatimonadota bacterium]|nr:pitrilysin family protein [Armatimonadota bacterium]
MTAPIIAAQVRRTVLPNGLVCLVKPAPELGAVALHGYVRAGSMFDGERSGLARFVAASLIRGTRRRSGPQIAEDLDAMGASLSVSGGIEVTAVTGRSLAADLPALLGIAAEVLTEPAFPADEIERVRNELITVARVNALDTRQVAERLFRRLVYPEGHPHRANPDGDEQVLAALAPDDLRAFHARRYRPAATILALVGDIDPAHATDLVASAFAAWPSEGVWVLPAFPEPAPPAAVQREEVTLPGKSQSDLVLGVPGISRNDAHYYAVMMANLFLGQLGMMGRIGQNVRERQGMAYYAFSDLRAGLLAGPWSVRAGVSPANVERAVSAILHEIKDLQVYGPSPDELADARTFLVGSLAVRLESTQGLAQTMADIELFNLGLDYLERYPGIINRTSREAIIAAMRRFPTEAYAVAVAGPERQG